MIISQIVKYVCAAAAAVIACFRRSNKGFMRGLLGALAFFFMGYIVYGTFGGGFTWDGMLWLDLLIYCVIGILCGAVMVNMNARKR